MANQPTGRMFAQPLSLLDAELFANALLWFSTRWTVFGFHSNRSWREALAETDQNRYYALKPRFNYLFMNIPYKIAAPPHPNSIQQAWATQLCHSKLKGN